MEELLLQFFRGDYMPHGHCYLWRPGILWMNVVSDGLIALAYFSIPVGLAGFVRARPDIRFSAIFLLFAAFILCCGITHIFGIITVWHGVYGWHGIAKMITAIVSVITAILLFRSLPQALKFPTPAQLEAALKKAADEELHRSRLELEHKAQDIFRFTIELLPTGLLVIDGNGVITVTNQALAKMFGYQKDELVGQPLTLLLPTEQQSHHDLLVHGYLDNPTQRHAMAAGRVVRGQRKDGTEVAIEISLSSHDLDGEKHAFASVVSISDVFTEQNLAMETSNRMKRAIEATNDGMWEWNVQSNNVWYSPRLMRMLGRDPENDQPKFEYWLEHIHPDDKAKVEQQLTRHFNQQEKYDVIYRGRTDTGEYEWLHARGDTLFDQNDRPLLMSGTLTNINEIKRLQEELSQKSHFLDAVLNKSLSGTYIYNLFTNSNVFINEQYTQLTGYTFSDLKQIQQERGLLPLFHPDDHEMIAQHFKEVCESNDRQGVAVEYRFKHKDGRWIWCYSRDSVYSRDASGTPEEMLGSFFDITELKEREEKIKHLATDFFTTFEQAAVGIAHVSLRGYCMKANQRLCSILGRPAEDVLNRELNSFILEADRKIDSKQMLQLLEGELDQYRVEKRLYRVDGDIIWANLTVSIVHREDSSNSHLIIVVEDISQRKAVSQALAESNASLERFAYSASHDLQEPLRKISAFSESLERRLVGRLDDPDARYELNRISNAASRMREMIDSLLQLSRYTRQKIKREYTRLSKLVAQAREDLSTLIDENKAVITLEGDARLHVDLPGFQQVLRNLFTNSIRYAMPGIAPKIHVSVEETNDVIRITVRDNGRGFQANYAEQIFEPFKRLAGRDLPGSGMGLALCRQILSAHEATISAHGVPDQGARFTITLKKEVEP